MIDNDLIIYSQWFSHGFSHLFSHWLQQLMTKYRLNKLLDDNILMTKLNTTRYRKLATNSHIYVNLVIL